MLFELKKRLNSGLRLINGKKGWSYCIPKRRICHLKNSNVDKIAVLVASLVLFCVGRLEKLIFIRTTGEDVLFALEDVAVCCFAFLPVCM